MLLESLHTKRRKPGKRKKNKKILGHMREPSRMCFFLQNEAYLFGGDKHYTKAKIVLSGYWSGRDDGSDLYDWYLIPHGWHRHLVGEYTKSCEVGESKSKGAEWIWCNYDLEKEAPVAIGFLESYCDDKKILAFQR